MMKLYLLFSGGLIFQVLSIGLRDLLNQTIWVGEGILFFSSLGGWLVFAILDAIQCRRRRHLNENPQSIRVERA